MKTLIITGGNINKNFTKEYLQKYSFNLIIAVDKGLEILNELGMYPNYIIGDFDSIDEKILKKYKSNKEIEIIYLKPEKDYTDTHEGLKLAIEKNSDEIIIMGAIGSRLDHTIANINILKEALNNKIKCKIVNENNEIQLMDKCINLEKNSKYKYISLIPLTTKVEGVTLKGFKYPLNDYTLEVGKSIGISNEQIEDISSIKIKTGILIIICSND